MIARSDGELLAGHLAGDPRAFEEIVARHRPRLRRVALRIVRNADDAEDAVQAALLRAFQSAHTFRGDAAVSSWLHRVVTNSALDLVMKPTRVTPEPRMDREDLERPTPDDVPELRLSLDAAVMALEPPLRSAFFLVALRGYSHPEAAELLGVPLGTAKIHVWRARARLVENLGDVVWPRSRGTRAASAGSGLRSSDKQKREGRA